MCNERYNGWRNRETWLVNVWYNPETKSDVYRIQEMLDVEYDAMPASALKDMLYLEAVDWDELANDLPEEEE